MTLEDTQKVFYCVTRHFIIEAQKIPGAGFTAKILNFRFICVFEPLHLGYQSLHYLICNNFLAIGKKIDNEKFFQLQRISYAS